MKFLDLGRHGPPRSDAKNRLCTRILPRPCWIQHQYQIQGHRAATLVHRLIDAAGVEFINGDQPGVRLHSIRKERLKGSKHADSRGPPWSQQDRTNRSRPRKSRWHVLDHYAAGNVTDGSVVVLRSHVYLSATGRREAYSSQERMAKSFTFRWRRASMTACAR